MERIRFLMTQLGWDAHDRGVKLVTTALRDAGIEVIYTGPWQSIEEVTKAAIEEDVDIIGVSSLAYDHVLIPKLLEELKARGVSAPVIVGGIVPRSDARALLDGGVAQIFPPGSSLPEIVASVKRIAEKKQV